MSDILNKVNQVGLNTDFPVAGQNNSSDGFRQNTRAALAGFNQATIEVNKIQKSRVTIIGDATGQSRGLGDTFVVGSSDPIIELSIELKDVLNATGVLNTAENDYNLSFDTKGRLISAANSPYQVTWTNGAPLTSLTTTGGPLGSGSGTIVLPVLTFNKQGRLSASSTQSITFGLKDHTLTKGSLLIGDVDGKSTELKSPLTASTYFLTVTNSVLSWQTAGAGGLSGIAAGDGIAVLQSSNSQKVSLDYTNLTANSTVGDGDILAIYSNASTAHRKVTVDQLGRKFSKLEFDSTPKLSGTLDVVNQKIVSSGNGVTIASAASNPTTVLLINQQGATLSASGQTALTLRGPLLTFNDVNWPTTMPQLGQTMIVGPNGLEWFTPVNSGSTQSVLRTLFVGKNGNDANGNGALGNPYLTINKALQSIPNNSDDQWTIVVLGGSYNESLVIQNKRKISLEGFFSASNVVISGTLQVNFGVDVFNMSNITWDNNNREVSDPVPVFSVLSGLTSGNIQNCSFLRGPGVKSDALALDLYGDITEDVRLVNCTVQGLIKNHLVSYDGARFIIQNAGLPNQGWTGLYTDLDSDTYVNGIPLMKGIRHDGGVLVMENVGGIIAEDYQVFISNPSLPVWSNSNPVFETDSNGVLLRYYDENNQPSETILLDAAGQPIPDANGTNGYRTTQYIQKMVRQPETELNYQVGLYSMADATSGFGKSRLELTNVDFYHDGKFSRLYKGGNCAWNLSRVKRSADVDVVKGPRISYDVQPDEGQVFAHFVASGNDLKFTNGDLVPEGVINPNSGKFFHVQLKDSAVIKLKAPVATLNPKEFATNITVVVRQDAQGSRQVTFQEDTGKGITWLGGVGANGTPDGLTVFSFIYLSSERRWVGQREAQGQEVKIQSNTQTNYTIQLGDDYIRRYGTAANQLTVPNNSEVALAVGTQVEVIQTGAGQTEIRPSSGVIINTPSGLFIKGKFQKVTLTKIALNTWDLAGDLDTSKTYTPMGTVDTNRVTADSTQNIY